MNLQIPLPEIPLNTEEPLSGFPVFIILCQEDIQRLHVPFWSHDSVDAQRMADLCKINGSKQFHNVILSHHLTGKLHKMQYAKLYLHAYG